MRKQEPSAQRVAPVSVLGGKAAVPQAGGFFPFAKGCGPAGPGAFSCCLAPVSYTHLWKGTDPHTGERVVAASAPIVYHGQTVAVVRYVTSLVAIDWQFFLAMGLACLLGAAILALVYFSNLYFVRSIVEPLASITETARLIADGSYGVQIEKKFDDEVGELTDTINDMSLKIKQSEKTQSEFISSVSHAVSYTHLIWLPPPWG